jgi:hypothetical protein
MQTNTDFVNAVRTTLQPEGRANATASTLEQLFTLTPNQNLADLAAAWQFLSMAQDTHESGPVVSRRKTCADLAQVATDLGFVGGDAKRAIPAWEAWGNAFTGSNDPRQAAMTETFAREVSELRSIS